MSRTFSLTRRLWLIAAWMVLLLAMVGSGFLVWTAKDLSISSGEIALWIPEDSAERRILDEFSDRFGAEDLLMISWEGLGADDPLASQLAESIIDRDEESAREESRPRYFVGATSYRDLRDSIRSDFVDQPILEERLREHLEGFLIGKNGETGVVLLEGSAYCADNRDDAFRLVEEQCDKVVGEDREFRFAGPLFVSVCANRETTRTLVLVTPIVAIVSLVVALILLRHYFLAFLSFGVSGLASLISLASIHLGGKELGDMLAVIPSIAQLLAMSNAIHFINYYREEWLRFRDGELAWRYSFRMGWLPTVAASLTTVIGFAALATSDLKVAGDFALYGGIGVLSAAIVVLLVIPAALIVKQPEVAPPHSYERAFDRALEYATINFRWPIAIMLTLVFALGVMGLSRLKPDVRTEIFFSEESAFRQDYDWYSDRFAPPTITNLMVGFPEGAVSREEQFRFIGRLGEDISSLGEEYAVYSGSILTLALPETPIPAPTSKAIYAELWDRAVEIGLATSEGASDYWHVSIRHPPDPDPRESAFTSAMEVVLSAASQRISPPPEMALTSMERLFAKSQDGLLQQMLRTFLLAFIVITPVVIIFLRSITLGAVAILGNLFPLAVFFGAIGWLGVRIDIATMLIAAVAFGIAVDDTVHFLTWLGKGFERRNTLPDAVRFAFDNCAGAILQTTLIISAGMMAFLLSDFRPSVRFATFTSTVLIIALIGDLIFLPSLILCFSRKVKNRFRGIQPEPDADLESSPPPNP